MNALAFLTGYMAKHAASEHCTPTGQVGVMHDSPAQTEKMKGKGKPASSEKEGKIKLLEKIKKMKLPPYKTPDNDSSMPGVKSTPDKGNLT